MGPKHSLQKKLDVLLAVKIGGGGVDGGGVDGRGVDEGGVDVERTEEKGKGNETYEHLVPTSHLPLFWHHHEFSMRYQHALTQHHTHISMH